MGTPLLIGIALFAAVLAAHVLIWRLVKPRSEIIALAVMFILAPGALFLAGIGLLSHTGAVAAIDLIAAVALYYALACAYIQTYPGFNCEIPTIKIARIIDASMPRGITFEGIAQNFSAAELHGSRAELLGRDGLIEHTADGQPMLGFKGRVLADFFIAFRKMYGLGTGKG